MFICVCRQISAPNWLVIDDVNQQALFTRVAAVVHHGGAGTTTAAARAGAPQVILPQQYDQHYWAARVEQLGIGSAHTPGMPSIESLTGALLDAMQPQVVSRAIALAAAVREDGAQMAAERLVTEAIGGGV
jgi:vancomycin aglycone glucosyltransferase